MAENVVSYRPTEEQDLIRSTARRFLEERIPLERVRELMMSDDGFDRILWKEMADLGWTGLTIEEELGGAGFGPIELSVLLEEMGRMVTPGPFLASAVIATTVIQQIGTAEQQAELLPPLAAGERIATLALFEGPRQWDPGIAVTSANTDSGGWVLSGEKRFVLDGHLADTLLVTASGREGMGVFVVSPSARGVEVTPENVLDPTRRQATIGLDDVVVGDEARLGAGDATAALRRALSLGTTALAAEQVGGAQRCMEMSVDYAKTRHQFGRPIGSFQAIKHRCANMLMKVESARSVANHAARVTEDEDELAIAAPLAGSICSDAYVWVAGENIQVHGGIGFTWEHDAHLYLKRAKSSSLLLGSPAHQRDLLGRAIGI